MSGQVHALAYDPTNPDIIYAGGDNCGLYRSPDNGGTWVAWNEGLGTDDPRWTSYVEDVVVVPTWSGAPASVVGVYAATRGGIAYRESDSIPWIIDTNNLTYRAGYAAEVGAAIPFSSLAFASTSLEKKLYAGAGNGRQFSNSITTMYPETGESGEYSVWSKSLLYGGQSWIADTSLGNEGTAYQIAVVSHPNDTACPVVVTSTGVHLKLTTGSWSPILTPATFLQKFAGRSTDFQGVAVGAEGVIYVLARRAGESAPGIYYLVPQQVADVWDYRLSEWESLESDTVTEKVPPQDEIEWTDVINNSIYSTDLLTIAVNPGATAEDDEIYVGLTPGETGGEPISYNGYFRHSKCLDGERRWVNILYRIGGDYWNDPSDDFAFSRDIGTDIQEVVIPAADMGWLGSYTTGSTVPLLYWDDPNDPDTQADRLFAALYHHPMVYDESDIPNEWTQAYCEHSSGSYGYQGFYSSRGLNIMSARDLAFKSNGNIVIGCGDFLGFEADSGGDPVPGFRSLDPFNGAAFRHARNVEVVNDGQEDLIFMLRGAPNHSGHMGFEPESIPIYQQYVVAIYDETEPYLWRYISQGIDLLMPDSPYELKNLVVKDQHTVFVTTNIVSNYVVTTSYVFRGKWNDGSDTWDWDVWWSSDLAGQTWNGNKKICNLTLDAQGDRLLVLTGGDYTVFEIDPEVASTGVGAADVWLDKSQISDTVNPRLYKSLRNPTAIALSPHDDWVYVTTSGQDVWGPGHGYHGRCANVIRAEVPADGTNPASSDWACLLFPEVGSGDPDPIQYTISPAFMPDALNGYSSVEASESLPIVKQISIHPDNPRRFFVSIRTQGFKAVENFHPNNGVWEYRPSGDSGTWHQIKGGSTGEPCKGIQTLGLSPTDSQRLVAGSFGQEFFMVEDLEVSAPPVSAVTAVEPIHPQQELLMVTLDPPAASALVSELWVDASELGLSNRLHLVDDGTGADWEAGDGIWTADAAGYSVPQYGAFTLPCYARDDDWNSFWGEVSVEVMENAPALYFKNVSPDVSISYAGTPSGIASVEIDPDGSGAVGLSDIVMSQFGESLKLFENNTSMGSVPQFVDRTFNNFADFGEIPDEDHGAMSVADINRDGLHDVVVPSGENSTDGLRFYRQIHASGPDGTKGQYVLESGWNPLSSALSENTWKAACADYDGDGYTDVYLCRAVSSGGMPDDSATAAGDILLRNDLAVSGAFVDATADIDLGPAALVSIDAAWCDYDGDGDLDLAVAKASAGYSGVYIYEHKPASAGQRFELVYPVDPAAPTWAEKVSALAWGDVDSDGELDLVVATYGTGSVSYFANGQFTSDPTALFTLPGVASSLGLADVDYDGDQDLVLTPVAAGGAPMIATNDAGTFTVESGGHGLDPLTGTATGVHLADYNDDGAVDLFLGRAKAANKFLSTGTTSGADWVGIRLLDDTWESNPVVGARVVVQTGASRYVAFTVGNGGNGRDDGVVRVGLDPAWSNPTPICDVYWSTGHQSLGVDLSQDIGSVKTLLHQDDFDAGFALAGNTYGFAEVKPQARVDFVFRWHTNKQTDIDEAIVIVDGSTTLDSGTADVEVREWVETNQGSPIYMHELAWRDRPCYPNTTVSFQVITKRGLSYRVSGLETFISKICTSIQDPQQ